MIKKYRKKPIVIEAIQYDGKNMNQIISELGMPEIGEDFISNDLIISTLEGDMRASIGDYIIKGVMGEFYPCKADVFDKSYELVDKE